MMQLNLFELLSTIKRSAFDEILEEINWVYDDVEALEGKQILELGPGRNPGFLNFLGQCLSAASLSGVGKSAGSGKWTSQPASRYQIHDQFILPYLEALPDASLDLIYSRHVLEMHSIDARILLKDPAYSAAVRTNSFSDLPEAFPASQKNILAIFAQSYRCLRPGGALITQVAKKKYAVLNEAGLSQFGPQRMRFRRLGRFSEISTFVK
jgi:hypothetical protein